MTRREQWIQFYTAALSGTGDAESAEREADAAMSRLDARGSARRSTTWNRGSEATMGLPVYASTERGAVVRFLRAEEAKFEREADAHDEECAKEMVASAVSPRLRDKASVLRTVASYIERGDHLASEAMAPLTPEVVLHAMLRAYEAAALDAAVDFMKAQAALSLAKKHTTDAMPLTHAAIRAAEAVEVVRDMLAAHIASVDLVNIATKSTLADYEARLAGTRPLDAPPLKVL